MDLNWFSANFTSLGIVLCILSLYLGRTIPALPSDLTLQHVATIDQHVVPSQIDVGFPSDAHLSECIHVEEGVGVTVFIIGPIV